MELHSLPEWVKPAFDLRFIERARVAGKSPEIEPLRLRQIELEKQLKAQLVPQLYQLILEWEEVINYRHTLEKESMYYAGVEDGLSIWKHLLNNISN